MKKKLLILLNLLFFTPFVINAEGLKMESQKSFGGSLSDQFNSIISTEDSKFVSVGYTSSRDIDGIEGKGEFAHEAIIIKYDNDGNILWKNAWGGDEMDYFYDVIQQKSGEFVVVGNSTSSDIEGLPNMYGGDGDAIIIKYDKNGNLLWQKSWGGKLISARFRSITSSLDDGIVVVGSSEFSEIEGMTNKGMYDAIIVKYDKDGNILWQKNWGGNGYDDFTGVISTEDGGFIIVGESESNDIEGLQNKGSYDAIVLKYDKDGNLIWQKSWGGNDSERFTSVAVTEDGGFVAVGNTQFIVYEGDSRLDAIIVKYNKDGNVLWQKSYGNELNEFYESVVEIDDYGFVVVGYINSSLIDSKPATDKDDAIIIKYDKDGNMLWEKSWGGSDYDEFRKVISTQDGKIIASGYSHSTDIDGLTNKGEKDAIIVKYSIEYNLENITTENGTSAVEQKGKYGIVTPTPNEGYEVDKIIVKDKDGNVLDVETTKQEDGTYSFDLYTDVSVEVLFKEKIENPKTGIMDFITIIFIGFAISISGFFIVKRYNERFEF